MSDIIDIKNNSKLAVRATQPCEPMISSFPDPYLMPQQSRYHNLGLNGYISPYYSQYPGKRPGSLSDYGPVQFGQHSDLRHTSDNNYPYPLDKEIFVDWMRPLFPHAYRKNVSNESSKYMTMGNM
jgi:hypothetical protein